MKRINTNKAPQAIGPYVQGVVSHQMFFSSGQIPINPKTGQIETSDIVEQTHQVMKNIAALLEEVQATFSEVIKTTCFLKDMNEFSAFNEVYSTYFTAGLPARSCVEVARLPKDVRIEIEVIVDLAP